MLNTDKKNPKQEEPIVVVKYLREKIFNKTTRSNTWAYLLMTYKYE